MDSMSCNHKKLNRNLIVYEIVKIARGAGAERNLPKTK